MAAKGVRIGIGIFAGVVAVTVLLFVLGAFGMYPPLTALYRSVFGHGEAPAASAAPEIPVIDGTTMDGRFPGFSGHAPAFEGGEIGLLNQAYGYACTYADDMQAVTLSAPSGPDGTKEYTVSYRFSAPLVFGPVMYPGCAVFADSSSTVTGIDLVSGEKLFAVTLPVFPGTRWKKDFDGFSFDGRNGMPYRFSFSSVPADMPSGIQPLTKNMDDFIAETVIPSDAVWEKMLIFVNPWLNGAGEAENEISVSYGILGAVPAQLSDTSDVTLVMLTPPEAGTWIIGIGDGEGRPVQLSAFVGVFSGEGDFLAGSLDYVGDNPMVSLALSPGELYYAVAGVTAAGEESGTYYLYLRKAPS